MHHLMKASDLRVVFQLLLEGPKELTEVIVLTIAHILDKPETRIYVRPAVDVEVSETM